MIFDSTTFIDDRLKKVAGDIEENEVGLRVIYGGVFAVPCVKINLVVSVDEPRRFNVLEEFILRAADELAPPVLSSDLATAFGLDPIFISTTCQELRKFNVLSPGPGDGIVLTNVGREFYKNGYIPKPAETRELSLIYTPLHEQIFISDKLSESQEDDYLLPGMDDSSDIVNNAVSLVSLAAVTDAVIKAGLGWHAPEVGKAITTLGGIKDTSESDFAIGLLILHDTADSSQDFSGISVRAYNFQTKQRDGSIEQYIQGQQKENASFLLDILPEDGSDEILNELVSPNQADVDTESKYKEEIISLYRERVIQERKKKEAGKTRPQEKGASNLAEQKGTVEYLWGDKIRPRFIQSLTQTSHTLLMMSPWITEDVVDKEFIGYLKNLAEKGVACVIGWGIAKEKDREERIPSAELLSSLNNIKTPSGIPSVTVWWLGNIHNKECIIDYRINLSGSHNWLSYRGDRAPRGESIHYVTIPGPVEQALTANEPLFIRAVKSVWDHNINAVSRNISELERCCAAWTALRRPGIALKNIEKVIPPANPQDITGLMKLMDIVYLTITRLPNDELSKIGFVPEALETEAKLARSIPNYLQARDQEKLARYLGRIAKENPTQINDSVTQHPDLWEQIGFYNPKHDPNILVSQLVKFAGEKKNSR
jgi:hypothetical protein